MNVVVGDEDVDEAIEWQLIRFRGGVFIYLFK